MTRASPVRSPACTPAAARSPRSALRPSGSGGRRRTEGRRATSFPGFLAGRDKSPGAGDAVVVDRGVITSRGPGTALDFALALVEELLGDAARQSVESRLEREKPAAA